jgi:hypothetical protein
MASEAQEHAVVLFQKPRSIQLHGFRDTGAYSCMVAESRRWQLHGFRGPGAYSCMASEAQEHTVAWLQRARSI